MTFAPPKSGALPSRQGEEIDPFLATEDTDGDFPSSASDRKQGVDNQEGLSVLHFVWPAVIAMAMIAIASVTFIYGPNKVLQFILTVAVPEEPQVEHGFAVWITIVVAVTCTIPISPLLLPVPALMFGFWIGWALSFTAVMTAAIMSFAIGRYIIQEPIRKFLTTNEFAKVMTMLKVIEREDNRFKFLVLYRFLMIPNICRNYALCILDVSFWHLVLAAVPHGLCSTFILSVVGGQFKSTADLIRQGHDIPRDALSWNHVLGGCFAFCAACLLSYLAYNEYSKEIARLSDIEEGQRHHAPGSPDTSDNLSEKDSFHSASSAHRHPGYGAADPSRLRMVGGLASALLMGTGRRSSLHDPRPE